MTAVRIHNGSRYEIVQVTGERVAYMRRISGGLVRCEGYVVDEVSGGAGLAYRVAIGGHVVTVDEGEVIELWRDE